jgi:hypothetical protein
MKAITRENLIAANAEAIRFDFNRAIREEVVESLPDAVYPVRLMMIHQDWDGNPSYRVLVTFDAEGRFAFLDMTADAYLSIPDREVVSP